MGSGWGCAVLGPLLTASDTEEAWAQPGRQPPCHSCTVHSLTLDVSGALSLHAQISLADFFMFCVGDFSSPQNRNRNRKYIMLTA